MIQSQPKISLLILTYNAPYYIYKTLKSIRTTTEVNYEVIVLDNKSKFFTRILLIYLQSKGWIDKLCLLSYNSLFARGNNLASQLADSSSSHVLLLNSDIEIRNPLWLKKLLDFHELGISSYGIVKGKPITRVDGYCFLIDKALYDKHKLDEKFQWHWGITKLQAQLIGQGYSVKGIANHEKYLHHFGKKSGKGYRSAKRSSTDAAEVASWFQEKSIHVVDELP